MSLSSSRPRVRSVSGTATAAGVAAGAVAISSLIRACISALNANEQAAVSSQLRRLTVGTMPHLVIPPPAVVANRFSVTERPALANAVSLELPEPAAVRASTLVALASTPALVDPQAVAQSLQRLLATVTPADAQAARSALVSAVQASHRDIFVSCLVSACADASRQIGLSNVETAAMPDGTVRVVASSDGGRALVTEITPGDGGEVGMTSEVIGGDGRCSQLMNQFDAALDERGVASDAPKRRRTGGVCELSAARAFVARRGATRASAAVRSFQSAGPVRCPRGRSSRNIIKITS